MNKRIWLALACTSILASGAALADTHPRLAGIKECDAPNSPADGHVRFLVKVSATGVVEDVQVAESSGDASSDRRAAKCVAGYSWTPATHNGEAVEGVAHFTFNFGVRVGDLADGPRKAFHVLERDADRRCRKLYPIDPRLDIGGQPITLVAVARLKDGEIQTKVMQSAGEKADAAAVKCVTKLVADHDDLPAEFARTIAVDWSHR
ncbi:TonB family protein [Rhizomicrobium electricum]|jgi:TonB family protein|uniref:TonB C-terminal domain-containing protein n=1 Tax=Rhizomicrobium electricum TaxID=480070 RepID=A0ABP3PMU8_9PROT|nr:TonB family protein [Rhizomicrobium electricum]NIJ48397.1 TonB family protein [Rhizomicrobium electricum]